MKKVNPWGKKRLSTFSSDSSIRMNLKDSFFDNDLLALSMYDQDGNGWIDLLEMTRIVKSIYSMMGPDQVVIELLLAVFTQVKASVEEQQSPEERAQGIFTRMDINSDGKVTRSKQIDLSKEKVGV